MAYLADLDDLDDMDGSCCAECADTGGTCNTGLGAMPVFDGYASDVYLGDMGFTVPDDGSVDPNVFTQADGSLESFGTVENLSSILPVSFANPSTNPIDATANALGVAAAPFTGGLSLVGSSAFQAIEHMFHLGRGRKEADIITPNQNVVWQYIVNVSHAGLGSNDPILLQQLVLNLQQLGYNWQRFLMDPRFTDGRASAQALNTIMPYLDGTCGYSPHMPQATISSAGPGQDSPCMPAGCGGCSNAWPGNFGYGAGLLGALRARVVQNGGTLPPANDVTQGIGVPTLQFAGTNGALNLGPQSGYVPPTGWFNIQPQPPVLGSINGGLLDFSSSTGLIAVALVGGLLLLRKRG